MYIVNKREERYTRDQKIIRVKSIGCYTYTRSENSRILKCDIYFTIFKFNIITPEFKNSICNVDIIK